jgi:peptidyl-prolyl cis-trans isomerase SurA
MKRLAVFLTLLLTVVGGVHAQKAEVIDGIAAIVNNDVITISQVRELAGSREQAIRQMYRGTELQEKLKEMRLAALKDLIDRQLVLQEFRKMQQNGANIPDYVVDDRVQTIIREEFGGDRSAFVRTLQAQGFTLTRFKEIEKEKIIVQALRQSKITDNFVISPTQIQAYYNKNKARYATPEQVRLRMIIIREGNSGDIPDAGSKKDLAREIREKIAQGSEFESIARMYSEDDTRDAGGDWGWVERDMLNEEITKVAFSLRPGEVSPVINVGDAYYIMMIDAKKNATIKPISEVRDEIERNLTQQERKKAQDRWLDSLRQKAYIKILS